MNRFYVVMLVKRDNKERLLCILELVQSLKKIMDIDVKFKKKSLRDFEIEEGDEYIVDLRKYWNLFNEEEKYDIILEIW